MSETRIPTFNQAEKIIAKLGGIMPAARLLNISRVTLYRWTQPRPFGTDGLVPILMVEPVIEAAERAGIQLTYHDWTAERVDKNKRKLQALLR